MREREGRRGGAGEQPNSVYSLRAYVSKYTNAAFVSVLREAIMDPAEFRERGYETE